MKKIDHIIGDVKKDVTEKVEDVTDFVKHIRPKFTKRGKKEKKE
jgi:hypothetical protein